ncbi:PREDICTED: uncharacterized protein LOC104610173 isoform X3 [Nelumbo nucifera]|uniref:Uncharacterized protein LOC104610173 isoform X3 n=1 Tax=Nelumbo nucifera TaxID=4432 RepID=A0A1U8B2G9_NELNU|nr:PREDICTED: uncharacterized protein LOC104610173 isoform X3 [Nelumbo nucifera]
MLWSCLWKEPLLPIPLSAIFGILHGRVWLCWHLCPQLLAGMAGCNGTILFNICHTTMLQYLSYHHASIKLNGVPCVIYWKNTFSRYAACHFRQALLSVVQSSCSHTWDAFQLAHASFRLYCVRNNHVLPTNSHKVSSKVGPRLLGEPPKINIAPPEKEAEEEDEEGSSGSLLAIKVYGDDVNIRFLVCGVPCTLDAFLLGSLEDGLNAILSIENSSLRSKFFTDTVSIPSYYLEPWIKCPMRTNFSHILSIPNALIGGAKAVDFDFFYYYFSQQESFVILCPLLHSSSKLPNEFSRPQGPKREIKEINPERRVTCPES